jgi:hypothetical protein
VLASSFMIDDPYDCIAASLDLDLFDPNYLGSAALDANMRRPCAVVVSAQASARDLNPALRSAMPARMFKRSRVLRANLSSLVTSSTSPSARASMALVSCARSVLAPLTFSLKTLLAPSAFRLAICASRVCPSVLTRA